MVRVAILALLVGAVTLATARVTDEVASLPGASPFPPDLQARLQAAVAGKGAGYRPRTRHLNADGSPRFTNRLILEASPYLQQHAHNPVNWYPWGDEAFERARRDGKPVLLSVGYATCHWCHVMEQESFEDEEIAAYLNQHYVVIKVDREQRPDIDGVYMTAVQMLTGGGGWPMTVWLTPDRQPFYGGTYFPPRDGERGARVGFRTLIQRVNEVYRSKPDQAAEAAKDLAQRVAAAVTSAPANATIDGPAVMRRAVTYYRSAFDNEHGGFGGAPKFPRSVELQFLLRYARRTGDSEVRRMVERTLEAMAAGGIHDQIGGGFHRYSTDARWLVPHFEKMLYDNALLAVAYLEGLQATGRPEFAEVARDILRYVSREMAAPSGGFYSASDADSDGAEGRFFVWTPAEIAAAIGSQHAVWFGKRYGVTEAGNFDGRSILFHARPVADVAAEAGLDPAVLARQFEQDRAALYAARAQRVPPLVDTKVIASGNGLMISAFARGAQVLGDAAYASQAVAAAEALLARLNQNGRLRHSVIDGRAEGTAYLDDYAFLAQGFLDLYEATFDARWLRQALRLHEVLAQHFWDEVNGGYYLTADDNERLLAREKPCDDSAEPSGNAIAVLNLLRLTEFTGDDRYRAMADRAVAGCGGATERSPGAASMLLSALDFRLDAVKEIVLVKPAPDADAEPFLGALRRTFLPNRIVAVVAAGVAKDDLATLVPLVADKVARNGKLTAYVCERRVCQLPTSDPSVFAAQIAKVVPFTASHK